MALHEKVNVLRDRQWAELLSIQQEKIKLPAKLVGQGDVPNDTGMP